MNQSSAKGYHDLQTRACLVVLLIAAGCGRSDVRPVTGPEPYPVTGQVLVDGNPAEGVHVTFVPAGQGSKTSKSAVGVTDREGVFFLSTYNPDDGAPVGKYKVALSWVKWIDKTSSIHDQPPEAEQLPRKYQLPDQSGLIADVREGENELDPFNVSTK